LRIQGECPFLRRCRRESYFGLVYDTCCLFWLVYNLPMTRRYPGRNNFIHWIAIIAILMTGIAPSISQTIANQKSYYFNNSFVCTTSAMNVEHSANNQPSDSGSDHKLAFSDQCGYCALQGTYFVPTGQVSRQHTNRLDSFYPELYYQSPTRLFSWIKLPSQAPPLQS